MYSRKDSIARRVQECCDIWWYSVYTDQTEEKEPTHALPPHVDAVRHRSFAGMRLNKIYCSTPLVSDMARDESDDDGAFDSNLTTKTEHDARRQFCSARCFIGRPGKLLLVLRLQTCGWEVKR